MGILSFDCLQNLHFTSKLFILKFYNLQNIYIFIKKYFPFQKKYFLYAIKKFFEAKFHLFCTKNLQFFLQKNHQKSPKKIFQSVFWPKCEKKFAQGSRRTFRNHQFGFGKL